MELLLQQAEQIWASNALGRSKLTRGLFDFLVDCSKRNVTPREIDIAVDVFGRTEELDISQDASVRVYVHRLRKKLDEYYEGLGREEQARLTIPKGEYRLDVRPMGPADEGLEEDFRIRPAAADPALVCADRGGTPVPHCRECRDLAGGLADAADGSLHQGTRERDLVRRSAGSSADHRRRR